MNKLVRSLSFCAGVSMVLLGCRTTDDPEFAVLIFSKTAGFRHESIEAGVDAIRTLGRGRFRADHTENAEDFDAVGLAAYRAVIFLNTTGDVLDASQQLAFEEYIRAGGGFVGVHAATDTEYDWAWYGQLVGAYFDSHPAIQDATLTVVKRLHASTMHMPPTFSRRDEWYNLRDVSGEVAILITVDESSYSGGTMGPDHPISWYHEFDGGRAWYTAMGHTVASYREPLFLEHLLGGILWAAGSAA